MSDADALALAWQVMPNLTPPLAPEPGDPLERLAAARRDPHGNITTWPTCARSGEACSRTGRPALCPVRESPILFVETSVLVYATGGEHPRCARWTIRGWRPRTARAPH